MAHMWSYGPTKSLNIRQMPNLNSKSNHSIEKDFVMYRMKIAHCAYSQLGVNRHKILIV